MPTAPTVNNIHLGCPLHPRSPREGGEFEGLECDSKGGCLRIAMPPGRRESVSEVGRSLAREDRPVGAEGREGSFLSALRSPKPNLKPLGARDGEGGSGNFTHSHGSQQHQSSSAAANVFLPRQQW